MAENNIVTIEDVKSRINQLNTEYGKLLLNLNSISSRALGVILSAGFLAHRPQRDDEGRPVSGFTDPIEIQDRLCICYDGFTHLELSPFGDGNVTVISNMTRNISWFYDYAFKHFYPGAILTVEQLTNAFECCVELSILRLKYHIHTP